MHGAEYVFHIAGVTKARREREFFDGNVTTTRNLLEAASRADHLRKFCHLSSLTAVGPSYTGLPLDEDSPCRPITAYGVSKLQGETLCQLYSSRVPLVIIRPPAVYGPRDQDILELFRWVRRGIKPMLGKKHKSLTIVHVTDLARAIVEATLSERTKGETYFVADQNIYSLTDIFSQLAKLMEKRTVPLPAPSFLVYSVAAIVELVSFLSSKPPALNIEKARDLVQPHWVCNARKIENHIGFRSQVTLDEGLKSTLDWYKTCGWL